VPAPSGDNFLQTLALAAYCFRRRHIPYAIIGAWALAVWGRPRSTQDLDFLVMVRDFEAISAALIRAGMERDENWDRHNPMLRGQQLRLKMHGVLVDLLRPRDKHDRELFRRRRRKRFANRYFWFVSAEDFIIQKLKTGRPKDFEDALAVLEKCGPVLDRRYMARWAARIGITGELDYVLNL
jgi:hypothetical protein